LSEETKQEKNVSRRNYVKYAGAGIVIVAAAGAGAYYATRTPSQPTTAVETTTATSESKLSEELNLYSWQVYLDPALIEGFENEYGVKVNTDFFATNEELLGKLQAGVTGYDLVCPSDFMVTIMNNLGLLETMDESNIPNLKALFPEYQKPLPYDTVGDQIVGRHAVPYIWGPTGIGYNTEKVEETVDSWGVMWPPSVTKYDKKISMMNSMRTLISAAAKYLGYSNNTTNDAELQKIREKLLEQKPYVLQYTDTGEPIMKLLRTEETYLSQIPLGYCWTLRKEGFPVNFVIPKEGCNVWMDCYGIPKGAPHKYTAEVFLNYALSPKWMAEMSKHSGFPNPCQESIPIIEADPDLGPEYVKFAWPPPEIMALLETHRDLGDYTKKYDEIWTAVMTG
jgi:spermidine/putrescine transport system substrate-binding protein